MKKGKVVAEEELKEVEGDLDKIARKEAEGMNQEDLDRKIEEAEERIKERPLTWRPEPGERKAVEVLDKVKKDTEFGETDFFIVKDLKTGQLFSLLGHGVLLKHLEVGKLFLLIYEGKVENGDKSYHRWLWEELE